MPCYQITVLRPSGAVMCAGAKADSPVQALAAFMLLTGPGPDGANFAVTPIPSLLERRLPHDA